MSQDIDTSKDHLQIRNPDESSENAPMPDSDGTIVRIGRELDNDIVLNDGRASRYHGELRMQGSTLEIKDLGSANGTQVAGKRIEAETWTPVKPGQAILLGETTITWERAAESRQATQVMTPIAKQETAAASAAAATPPPAPPPQKKQANILPWVIVGALLLLLFIGAAIFGGFLLSGTADEEVAEGVATEEPAEATDEPAEATDPDRASPDEQAVGSAPTETPTPSGPQLAIPQVTINETTVEPIILGALPTADRGLLLLSLRVQNVGNAPFELSTDDFSVRTVNTGEVFEEAGGSTSADGLVRLGVRDRFNDLTLRPGGSVEQDLIFELEAESYNLELFFNSPEFEAPVILSLGEIDAGRELSIALGTPVATEEPVAIAETDVTPTPTTEPTPTATRPALIPAPQVVSRSSLVGTIAYPVFNGDSFDIYFGDVATGETRFYRAEASQPAFSHDGNKIAFHSWSGASRGLVAMDVSGSNATLMTNFVEDQLPTWETDNQTVILLTRRTGDRKSQLMRVDSSTELDDGTIIGEGEYPSMGPTGQLAFKGWGTTAFGLRVGTPNLENLTPITNADEDTAPVLSPDGTQIAFMSRREEGNWDVYVSDVDGENLVRLTEDEAQDGLPAWSPDGNAIAFVSNRGGPWAVWAVSPDGGGQRQLFTMEGSPDGQVGPDTFASRGWAEERISWTAGSP